MSDTNTLVDFEWLLSDAAQTQLASVTAELDSGRRGPTPALIERLRRELPVDRARMLVGQVALRERATKKFSQAAKMYFTPILLEQATSEAIAHYKAASFPEGDVMDLCCGIGGDAIGLASREIDVSNVTVMDRDEVACRLASHNTRAYAASGCEINPVVGDVADAPVAEFSAWHIDPDRRPDGRRTTQVASHEPGIEVLEKLLAANGNAAIKLAPATELPASWSASCEQEWVGEQRECKQQLLRFGSLARAEGKRTATIVDANGRVMGTVSGSLDEPVDFVPNVADYFYEPHAAVRAAGLTGAVAKQREFCRMGTGDVVYDRTQDRDRWNTGHVSRH